MAESEQNTEVQQQTYTAYDLEIEKLNARIGEMETNYQNRIKELEDANRGLWAQLHPVQEAPATQEAPTDDSKAEKALFDALGIKEE